MNGMKDRSASQAVKPHEAAVCPSMDESFVIKRSFIDALGLRGSDLIVYSFIASRPFTDISYAEIGARCGLSRRSVQRSLTRLLDLRYLVVERGSSGCVTKILRASTATEIMNYSNRIREKEQSCQSA